MKSFIAKAGICVFFLVIRFLNAQVMAGTGDCFVEERNPKTDKPVEIRLGNSYLNLTVNPDRGGIISSFVYKGKEFTAPDWGMLEDHIWHDQPFEGDFFHKPYSYEILDKGPKKISLQLVCRGKVGMLMFVEIVKTIMISKDSSAVKIDYEIKNLPEAMGSQKIGLWWHNVVYVKGDKINTYFTPIEEGINRINFDPEKRDSVPQTSILGANPGPHIWFSNPSRGWSGVIGDGKTGGVIVLKDYPHLQNFYNYFAFEGPSANIEWRFNKIEIKEGESFKTTFWVLPFSGLSSLSGASSDVAGGIDLEKNYLPLKEFPIKVNLYSPILQNVKAVLKSKVLPEDKWFTLKEETVSFSSDETKSFTCSFKPDKEGTYIFRCFLDRDGKEIGELEESATIGKGSGTYALVPKEKRIVPEENKRVASQPDLPISDEVVTPHTKWGKPYYKGKIKTLVLVNYPAEREIIELAQRFDLSCEKASFYSPNYNFSFFLGRRAQREFDLSKEDIEQNMLRKLNEVFQVIIIGGINWVDFPNGVQEKIVEKVQTGTSLVYVSPAQLVGQSGEILPVSIARGAAPVPGVWLKEKPHFITDGFSLEGFPQTSYYPCKSSGEVLIKSAANDPILITQETKNKSGRVVVFGYAASTYTDTTPPGLIPYLRGEAITRQAIERYYAFLGKALLWAAHQEPEIRIKTFQREGEQLHLGLENTGGAEESVVQITFRNGFYEEKDQITKKLTISAGHNNLLFPLSKALPGGLALAELWIKDRKGNTVNWAIEAFSMHGAMKIADLHLDKDIIQKAEPLTGKVMIESDFSSKAAAELILEVKDKYGRLTHRTTKAISIEGGKMEEPFSLALAAPLIPGQQIAVILKDKNGIIEEIRKSFLIRPETTIDDFIICNWYTPSDDCNHFVEYKFQKQREMGVNTLKVYRPWRKIDREDHRWVAENGFHLGVNNVRRLGPNLNDLGAQIKEYRQTKDKRKLVTLPECFNDPKSIANDKEWCLGLAKELCPYGVFCYYVGDENSLVPYGFQVDWCYSTYCLAEFRKWLQDQYFELGALNKEWETDFKSWEEVIPMPEEEVKKRANSNYAPWADHRDFMEKVVFDVWDRVKKNLKTIDKNARMGICGTGACSPYFGLNWWRLSKLFEFMQPYERTLEFNRSFNPGLYFAPSTGYGMTGPALEYGLWHGVNHGGKSIWLWTEPEFINPDLTLDPSGKDVKKYSEDLRNGIGRLLMNCEWETDKIAVHYSHNSMRAVYVSRPDGFSLFDPNNIRNLEKLLEDLLLQYNYVSSEQIEGGELSDTAYKVLFLPYSMALSEKEANQIQLFAEKGGVVIADFQTGLMDGHCKLLSKGQLDEFFGFERRDFKAFNRKSDIEVADFGGLTGKRLKISVVEPGISAATARPFAKAVSAGLLKVDAPAILVNNCKKGKAIYLNLSLYDYLNVRKIGREAEIKDLMKAMLKFSGVESRVKMTCQGNEARAIEAAFFKADDKVEYLNVTRDIEDNEKSPKEMEITLPYQSYLYDVREKKYLGFTDKAKTIINPGQTKVFALLPYMVSGLELKTEKNAMRGRPFTGLVNLNVSGGKSADHVLYLEVYNPEGGVVAPYTKTILSKEGKCAFEIPFALNDPEGKWRIKVGEVVSGKTVEKEISLRGDE